MEPKWGVGSIDIIARNSAYRCRRGTHFAHQRGLGSKPPPALLNHRPCRLSQNSHQSNKVARRHVPNAKSFNAQSLNWLRQYQYRECKTTAGERQSLEKSGITLMAALLTGKSTAFQSFLRDDSTRLVIILIEPNLIRYNVLGHMPITTGRCSPKEHHECKSKHRRYRQEQRESLPADAGTSEYCN